MEQIDRALDVNLRAPIVLAHALAPAMIGARRRAPAVHVLALGQGGAPGTSSLYSATKFGLRGFASGLRADLHASGVGVSVVFPGFIRDAGMFADAEVKLPTGVGTRSPEDVARAVVRARSSAIAPRSMSPRLPCAPARSSPASPPDGGDGRAQAGRRTRSPRRSPPVTATRSAETS